MKEGLSTWQLTMMALGTVIGGSFFLGSAVAVRAAGPAVVISYVLGGILVYFILFALSEMTVADPDSGSGSFRAHASQAYGPGLGFVVGWVYWTGLVLAMSSEATAVGIFIRGWFPGMSLPLIGSVVIIAVTVLNLLGAERLSKVESALSMVKLLAIVGFVILGVLLIVGFMPGVPRVGLGSIMAEPLFPAGVSGIAGSMLIVMFTYAGFEIIGLAASEAKDPAKTVPRAITYTVIALLVLYITSIVVLLPLVPTGTLTGNVSPLVAALTRRGLGWAGNVINIVLVTAILSTMLASVFGLGRMIRSLADEGHAPTWIKGKGEVPYRGILFSGAGMLLGLGLGLFLPKQVYVFLSSSGGFSLLFTYAVIIAAHLRFRKKKGCPEGKCQLPGYPVSSWFVLISLVAIIICMPLVPGQGAGLVAGLSLLSLYTVIYWLIKSRIHRQEIQKGTESFIKENLRSNLGMESSKELFSDKDPRDE